MRYLIHFRNDQSEHCIAEAEVEAGTVTSLTIAEECVDATGYSRKQLIQFIKRLLKPQKDRQRLRKRFLPGWATHADSLERTCGPFSVKPS